MIDVMLDEMPEVEADLLRANWSTTYPAELIQSHLARPCQTARCYRGDLAAFTHFLSAGSEEQAVRMLLDRGRGAAERIIDNYKAYLREKFPALNTGRRMAHSIMSLIRKAHKYRVIDWQPDAIKMPAAPPIRDTRGPARDVVYEMLAYCDGRADAKGCRDSVLIRLLAVSALRSQEALTLDLTHIDIQSKEVEILAKGLWGRSDRVRHPITLETANAVARWLEFRGTGDGPLLTNCQRGRHEATRLTYRGAYETVRYVAGRAGGCACSPHKLRHFATTEVLRQRHGDITWAMALTRHRDPRTLMIYNDERMIRAREAMELIDAGMPFFRV
jgi:integrase/recombinase XerC